MTQKFRPNKKFCIRRHEVPVSSEEIKIVHIDEDLVVVNKPASIPVSNYYQSCQIVLSEVAKKFLKNAKIRILAGK